MSDRFYLLTTEKKRLIWLMLESNHYSTHLHYSGDKSFFFLGWSSGGETTLFQKFDYNGKPWDLESYDEKCEQAKAFAEYLVDNRYKLVAGDEA